MTHHDTTPAVTTAGTVPATATATVLLLIQPPLLLPMQLLLLPLSLI